ncbi:KedN5 family methylcobalamin-dependent radical SAM C-methyltransferase [Amycolatopsis acidicola]|uniref:KedN5 family methylcobalamin-dependent radical SAM C-methyltransferase n=1 Tax=Amycolatopsis acidicola TaxID=2596893 RepID=A0A5N0VPF6_9PSEU|nr:KedN5 family methylcobalamin-dependent radical SAM C-methyltransferase [Amycolatopsis acidicola]KAA9166501.1 KedN5 family methylcobalamin-dependent radical SAM C-methyltransferase [Amycolatopsis acidicola]
MLTIGLVQQGAWDMPLESMPLAAGYLKAVLDSDPGLAGAVTATIHNFRGGVPLTEMARGLFAGGRPDVLAFSVLGWNYRNFGALAETFKQLNPGGVVVFGGNHVANQGARVLREMPHVDFVVNGEGENTFRDLVRYLLEHPGEGDPAAVPGLSYRRDHEVHTTEDAARIEDLDLIPSPFLTGAIAMTGPDGRFRYDVALMETNRGCPYKCSFCYWGGAVGQRVRSFSRERLAEELDFFAFHEVPALVLCDANFGLLEADEEFVEDLIKTRERRGFPRALETSWAKNKSARFHRIVTQLQRHGFKSSFTLALQTLSDEALTGMKRRNMKVNQWEDLVTWLSDEGLDCYAELIWGAPGETRESFLEGYDRLAGKVSRIAVYPLLLLPNTSYTEHREVHGFVTLRGEHDDFEYVLANRSADLNEHIEMQRFVLWARVLGENQFLRHCWRPAVALAGFTQSGLITSLMRWFESSSEPLAQEFCAAIPVIAESPAVAGSLRALYSRPRLEQEVEAWWRAEVVPRFPVQWRPFAEELYTYEHWTRPVYADPRGGLPPGWRADGASAELPYRTGPVRFTHDMGQLLKRGEWNRDEPPAREEVWYEFRAKAGFYEHMDNHETAAHYTAEPLRVDPVAGPC